MTVELAEHTTGLPVVSPDLHDLPVDGWCHWPVNSAVVRRLDDTRYVAVIGFLTTDAVIWGWIGNWGFYEDRWCYSNPALAIAAATAWDGAPGTEPYGWHRHPSSGRRRPNGDETQEYVNL